MADIRQRNRPNIRRDDLDGLNDYFESYAKNFAEPQEIAQIEKLLARAETLIERDDSAFEDTVDEIRGLCFKIIFFRDDEYAVYMFNDMIKHPDDCTDRATFNRLAQAGKNSIAQKNFNELRRIIFELWKLGGSGEDALLTANIIKG